MAEAIDEVNGFRDTPTGTLRLNVPGAAQPILAPMVARFLSLHPGIRLEITVDNNFVDVFAEGFDAGIRYDESLALDMIALPIGPPSALLRRRLARSRRDIMVRPNGRKIFSPAPASAIAS